MNFTTVIPVYNEASNIKNVIKDVKKYSKKIIVINDKSTDKTKSLINKMSVYVINNKINLGYSKSLEKGINKAFKTNANYVITFDGDGQFYASDIKKIVKIILKSRPDIIVGNRMEKNRFMEVVFGLYSKKKYGFSDPLCGLKAYNYKIYKKYGKPFENFYSIGTELLFKAANNNAKIIEIKIKTKKRKNKSRFGNSIFGNLYELRAFINILKLNMSPSNKISFF